VPPRRDGEPVEYELRVGARLDPERWASWFGGMALEVGADGVTTLRGPVADQAALYGLLARLRDLAVPLLSVNTVE
jgi:hypothetical protein